MGHVLLAAPTIERFHLHEQLGRRLMRRGHRVTLLATDPVTFRCFETHGLPARLLRPGRGEDPAGLPVHELAVRDATLEGRGRVPIRLDRLRRLRVRLSRRARPLVRLFETEIPDVVVLQGRTGLHRLIDAAARAFGCSITHLGPGLLTGTTQRDRDGLDGDSTAARRPAGFYRGIRADRAFCDAALVAVLGDVDAPAVARRFVHPPDAFDALACTGTVRSRIDWSQVRERLAAWRRASRQPFPQRGIVQVALPERAFTAVLLQSARDPRLALDVDAPAPDPLAFVAAVQRAAARVAPALELVVVQPGDADPALSRALRGLGCHVLDPDAAALAAATAAVAVTVNHPLATAAILAGTPLLHLGRALYAVRGVAEPTTLDALDEALPAALASPPQTTLRSRFLTRVLGEDHLWCDLESPDPNGLRGLLAHVEDALRAATPPPEPTPYRSGPDWPSLRGR